MDTVTATQQGQGMDTNSDSSITDTEYGYSDSSTTGTGHGYSDSSTQPEDKKGVVTDSGVFVKRQLHIVCRYCD